MSEPSEFSEPELLDDPANPREKPMGFFEHLEELRWTLVKSAIAYGIFAIAIGIYLKEFNHVILWPLEQIQKTRPGFALELGTTSIMEGFSVVIQMCALGALGPASPFILYFIGQFVSPALSEKEMKMVLPTAFMAMLLFLCGCAFSFFLLVPSTIKVSLEINELLGFATRWTPGSYYSLLVWLVLGVGLSFEFPLLIVLLVYMRMLSVATLRKYRRHAIVVIFIIAAVVTPTPDPFTQTMFAAPLYILFELAVLVGGRVEKLRALREKMS